MSVITKDIDQKEKKAGTSGSKERTLLFIVLAGVTAVFATLIGARKTGEEKRQDANKAALEQINEMEFPPFVDDSKETSQIFHEMSFLQKMIIGSFANSNESDFNLEEDKKLFYKYKDLSKIQQETAYKDLEKKLNESLEVAS